MKTFREKIIDDIFKFSEKANAFELVEKEYGSIGKESLVKELIQVGIMPEVFEHDSSEEKLWSKFSDIILARTLGLLGLKSEVLRARGNSADVYSKAKNYTLVSDAVVTSPPYDGLRNYNGYHFSFESIARELFRVTKKGGVVVWVIGDATIDGTETGTSFKQALFLRKSASICMTQ